MSKLYTTVATFPSSSKNGKFYTVKVDEKGSLSCDCKVWIFNQKGDRTCYHTMSFVARCSGTFAKKVSELPVTRQAEGDGIARSSITGEAKRKVRIQQ